jgi:hypothetical protein
VGYVCRGSRLQWTSAAGFLSTLFSLLISAYPFVRVISPRIYTLKIAATIVTSNLIAIGFYKLRTRTSQKQKATLSKAA